MRIISGKLGGRRFDPPAKKWPTRPTTDMAREGLFNILQNQVHFEDLSVLDLFGGTGGVSFEFYSRGCTQITYVDNYTPCFKYVQSQKKAFDIADELEVTRSDVFKFISRIDQPYDLIFADPPYAHRRMLELPTLLLNSTCLKENGRLIIEHDRNADFKSIEGFLSERKYGGSFFSFFELV